MFLNPVEFEGRVNRLGTIHVQAGHTVVQGNVQVGVTTSHEWQYPRLHSKTLQ